MLDVGKDIHSLSDFKRNTSEFLERMRGSGHPLGRNGIECVAEAPKAEGSHDHHNRLET